MILELIPGESRYANRCSRGALQRRANFRSPPVYEKRRSRKCPAFFYARVEFIHVLESLRGQAGIANAPASCLWFETEIRAPEGNCPFSVRTPKATLQKSLCLCLGETLWLTPPFGSVPVGNPR